MSEKREGREREVGGREDSMLSLMSNSFREGKERDRRTRRFWERSRVTRPKRGEGQSGPAVVKEFLAKEREERRCR